MRRITIAALCLASTLLVLPANAADRVETKPYTGSTVATVYSDCPYGFVGDDSVGGACFQLEGGESSVEIELADATGMPVGADVYFLNGATLIGGVPTMCGAGTMAVPQDAALMVVAPDWFSAAISCPRGTIGGVTGTITSAFTF